MGYIDKTTYTLNCKICDISETASVLEKGSAYGSSWQSGASFKHFKTEWDGGDKIEPTLVSATCEKCRTQVYP